MGWRTVAAVLDAGTATCAAINAAYFLDRLLSGGDAWLGRRLAVGILALASLAALVEAAVLLALAADGGELSTATGPWTVVRLLVFAGAAAISALVLRRWLVR